MWVRSFCNIFLWIIISTTVYSQKEYNNWYFGYYAGISFQNGSPFALLGSAMQQAEGTATISDNDGNLLFYTNGRTVFNKVHLI